METAWEIIQKIGYKISIFSYVQFILNGSI